MSVENYFIKYYTGLTAQRLIQAKNEYSMVKYVYRLQPQGDAARVLTDTSSARANELKGPNVIAACHVVSCSVSLNRGSGTQTGRLFHRHRLTGIRKASENAIAKNFY